MRYGTALHPAGFQLSVSPGPSAPMPQRDLEADPRPNLGSTSEPLLADRTPVFDHEFPFRHRPATRDSGFSRAFANRCVGRSTIFGFISNVFSTHGHCLFFD